MKQYLLCYIAENQLGLNINGHVFIQFEESLGGNSFNKLQSVVRDFEAKNNLKDLVITNLIKL